MQPQAKDNPGPQELQEAGRTRPGSLEREWGPEVPSFWTSNLQTLKE